jgi:phenylalanyl-tRNA synthetase alpha chain
MRYWASEADATAFIHQQMEVEAQRGKTVLLPEIGDDTQPCYKHETQRLVAWHLQRSIESSIVALFKGLSLPHPTLRWTASTFPFTSPSFELEVLLPSGEWLELLGCGITKARVLEQAGLSGVAWAFGMGLERIAMALFRIPDIRLFWSEDARFIDQFKSISTPQFRFKPFSSMPECYKDVSFWIDPATWRTDNDVFDVIRQIGGELVESVKLVRSRFPTHFRNQRLTVPSDRSI